MKTLLSILLFVVMAIAPSLALAEVGADLENKYGVVTDAAMNARLDRVAAPVQMGFQKQYPRCAKLHFKILNDENLNACALADGRVYITSGMMQVCSDDQLSAVINHEVTHIGQRHHRSQLKNTLIGAIFGGLIGYALGGDKDSIRTGAQVVGGLVGGHYSRVDEYRADAGSVELLRVEGYNPLAMAEALQMLQDKYGRGMAGAPILGWFASHPDTKNRVERATKLAGAQSQVAQPSLPVIPAVIPEKDRPRVAVIVKDRYYGWNGFWGTQNAETALQSTMEDALLKTGVFTVVDRASREEAWQEQDLGQTGRMEPETVPAAGHTVGANFFLYVDLNYYQVTQGGEIRIGDWGRNVRTRIVKAEVRGKAKMEPVEKSIVATSVDLVGSETGQETDIAYGDWTTGVDIHWESHPAGQAVEKACQAVASVLAAKYRPMISVSTVAPPPINLDRMAVVTLHIRPKDGSNAEVQRQIEVKLSELVLADYLVYYRGDTAVARINLVSQVSFSEEYQRWEVKGVLFAPSWGNFTKPGYMEGATEIRLFKN